jgi:hypothetical protein
MTRRSRRAYGRAGTFDLCAQHPYMFTPAPEDRVGRRVLSVRGIPGVVTRCCRDAGVGGRGCSGCWLTSAGSVVSASPGWAGGSSAVTGLLLIWVPGVPAVTRRACASGPGQHYGLQELAAALKLAPRSGPARRAAPLALPWCSWWPGSQVELRVLAPQNPHKSGSAA